MEITFLGHAGFIIENQNTIIVADPWLSPHGAFDCSWFQFPENHHLAALVQEKLCHPRKEKYVYISHEHKDHFDLPFLRSLPSSNFAYVVGEFQRPFLREQLATLPCKRVVALPHGGTLQFADGALTMFLDDSGLNRDSAILVESDGVAFLNINDCKIHDQLPAIRRTVGHINVFASQFSGATWHPVCYDYDDETYARISQKKKVSKLEATARSIEAIKPDVYIPSAGPACFLDPILFDINLQSTNIFPNAFEAVAWLGRRLAASHRPAIPVVMPGDIIDGRTGAFLHTAPDRLTAENINGYLTAYAARYASLFRARQAATADQDVRSLLIRLKAELERKVAAFTLCERVRNDLYVRFNDGSDDMLKVEFRSRVVTVCREAPVGPHYSISAPSWVFARVLNGQLLWEDLSLTFRVQLNRQPDVYQTLIQGFLVMEPEDLHQLCENLLQIEQSKERIIVEAGGCRYSVDKRCPHQGADLSEAWIEGERFLTCPRHRWRFDLQNGGFCEASGDTIHAIPLEDG